MALLKLVRGNYDGKSPASIRYQNSHSFKEGMILLCQSIYETRRISHLHGSALFTIPLRDILIYYWSTKKATVSMFLSKISTLFYTTKHYFVIEKFLGVIVCNLLVLHNY